MAPGNYKSTKRRAYLEKAAAINLIALEPYQIRTALAELVDEARALLKPTPTGWERWRKARARKAPSLFDKQGNYTGEPFPPECVAECSASGAVDEAVASWCTKLGFAVPHDLACRWLQGFGAWSRWELRQETNETISQRVLWLACSSIKEDGEWHGLVH